MAEKISKKAQFFSLYLVLITLFMCFISIMIYNSQLKSVSNSFVSPSPLLKIQNEREIFEIQEYELLVFSAKRVSDLNLAEWGSEEFLMNVKGEFEEFLFMPAYEDFRSFLILNSESNEKDIYLFSFENDKLKIVRKPIIKNFKLAASVENKINFPVSVEYKFEKEYLISKEDLKNPVLGFSS